MKKTELDVRFLFQDTIRSTRALFAYDASVLNTNAKSCGIVVAGSCYLENEMYIEVGGH